MKTKLPIPLAVVLLLWGFLAGYLVRTYVCSREQSPAAMEHTLPPQPGELWELVRDNPSPLQAPTILYDICRVERGWVLYTHAEIYTCAEAPLESLYDEPVEKFVRWHYKRADQTHPKAHLPMNGQAVSPRSAIQEEITR